MKTYGPGVDDTRVRLSFQSATLTGREMEERVGLTSHKLWQAGDLRVSTGLGRHRFHGCQYEAAGDRKLHWRELLAVLLEDLGPYAANIRSLADDPACEHALLSIVIYTEHYNPDLYMPRDCLQRLAAWGCSLDISAYSLPGNESE